jgi:hypothetical protein
MATKVSGTAVQVCYTETDPREIAQRSTAANQEPDYEKASLPTPPHICLRGRY